MRTELHITLEFETANTFGMPFIGELTGLRESSQMTLKSTSVMD